MENPKIKLVAMGLALSGALTGVSLLCAVAAAFFPGYQASHNWLSLFSAAEPGTLRNFLEAVLNGILGSWIAGGIFTAIYNRFSGA